jgi:hypothetical protein
MSLNFSNISTPIFASTTTNIGVYDSLVYSNTLYANFLQLQGGNISNTLNFNSNINFNNNINSALPIIGTSGSLGDRIILRNSTSSETYGYSIGINSNSLWLSSPDSINLFTTGNNCININSIGNVGIGTSANDNNSTDGLAWFKLIVDGPLTATNFTGNGSGLSNLDPTKLSSAVPVNKGGTGKTTINANSILYAEAVDTLAESPNLTWNNSTNTLSATNLTIQGMSLFNDIASFSNSIYQSNIATSNILMGNVSIGTVEISTHKLDVFGNINATSFSGDGSLLNSLDAANISTGTLSVARGGTNLTSLVNKSILYATSTTTLTTDTKLTFDENILAINGTANGTPLSSSTWAGARITIFSSSTSSYPYAIGYNTNSFIFSIPTAGGFNWYADSNIIMRLTSAGELSVIGDIIAFNSLSDINLKTNIKSLNINCIDLINKINPVEFTWKNIDDIISNKRNKTDYGFIAQEIESLIPTLIYDSKYKSKYKLIKYDKFAPYFVKAIQELHKIILEQKTEIEELKKDINNIKLILANNNLS